MRPTDALQLAAALFCLSLPSLLWAQRCDPASLEVRERAAQGENLAGRHDSAHERFRLAYDDCHHPRTLARLALTEAALGRWADADSHLREALSSSDPWINAHREPLSSEAARIDTHIGEILITGAGPSGSVWIDGQRVADWPMEHPARTLIGPSHVRVTVEGHEPVDRTVTVEHGLVAREHVSVTLREAHATLATPRQADDRPRPSAPFAPRERAPSRRPWTEVGLTTAGLAVGALAIGTVLAVSRADALHGLASEGCYGASPPVSRCDGLADDVDADGAWSAVGFAVGGALAAVAVTSLVLHVVGERRAASSALACASRGHGVGCGWSF